MGIAWTWPATYLDDLFYINYPNTNLFLFFLPLCRESVEEMVKFKSSLNDYQIHFFSQIKVLQFLTGAGDGPILHP